MLILCLELVRGRLGVMSADVRKLFFFILTTLIEKSPVSKWITGTLAVLFNGFLTFRGGGGESGNCRCNFIRLI